MALTCSQDWPLVTHSVPTLILGLQKYLIIIFASIWNVAATLPGNVSGPEIMYHLEVDVYGIDSMRPFFTYSLALSLVVAAFGYELYTTAAHDTSSEHVAVKLLLC